MSDIKTPANGPAGAGGEPTILPMVTVERRSLVDDRLVPNGLRAITEVKV
jgi:hypothetical protein